ncbi:MAG TPA: phosphodiesterase [Clostridia bacterium]|nr:phosphodiesterase [Clostridia bacterium]
MILITSDTHGDLAAWEGVMNKYQKDLKLILHAGDVLYHGPRNPLTPGYAPQALADSMRQLPVPLLIAQGNCDSQVDEMVLELPLASEYIVTIIAGKKVLLHHGHRLDEGTVQRLCRQWAIDLCIQGHTHVPVLTRIDNTVFLNPGSPSLPKQGKEGTIGLWEGETISLVAWQAGQVVAQIKLE